MKPARHLPMIFSFHLAAILIYFVVCGVSRPGPLLSGSLMISRTLHFRNAERFAVDFPAANTGPYDP